MKEQFLRNMKARGFTKARAREVLGILGDSIVESLAETGEARISGVCCITRVERPAGKFRNPATGDIVEIGSRSKVRFKPSKRLVKVLND